MSAEQRVAETPADRQTRELANHLFSYRYLHDHDLLREPPPGNWAINGNAEPDPDDPDGDDGGPPYAGAMAMPRPPRHEPPYRSFPARIVRDRRRAAR